MPAFPVRATPRPVGALLVDALSAWIDPLSAPRPAAAPWPRSGVSERYAGFDVPTYQRRGIRIAGLPAAD